jgi:GntR family transcriptional regulator
MYEPAGQAGILGAMSGPKPVYRQIADSLRVAIADGTYAPGTQLPSERELGDQFGAARNTVRLGLGVLVGEGLIVGERGRGYFVRDRVPLTYYASRSENLLRTTPEESGDSFNSDVRDAGRAPRAEFTLKLEPASAYVAECLRLEEGASTVLRSVLRFVDGAPWSIQNTWYPMDLAEGTKIIEPFDIKEGTTRYLATLGYIQVGYWDEWVTRMPTPDESRNLELGPGTPVLVCLRTAYTAERSIRVTETIFAGDRNRIVYEIGDLSAREVDA